MPHLEPSRSRENLQQQSRGRANGRVSQLYVMKAFSPALVVVLTSIWSASAQERDAAPPVPIAPAQSVIVQQGVETNVYVTTTTTNPAIVVTNRPIALRIVGSNVKNLK